MPSGKPTFDKINDLLVFDSCNEILKDLGYAVENYNTKFGWEMLQNAIKKLQAFKKAHDTSHTKPRIEIRGMNAIGTRIGEI